MQKPSIASWIHAARILIVSGAVFSAAPSIATTQPPGASSSTDVYRELDAGLLRAFGGFKAVTNPLHDAVMGFSLATKVSEVVAKGGQEVTKGQVLVRGDDAEDQALLKLQKVRTQTDLPVQRAKKQMELAETEYKIQQEVADKGGSSPQQVDRARLAAEVARIDYQNAQVQQTQEVIQQERMQARVDRYRLEAPFDGVVDRILLDVGQAASENDKVVRVVSIDTLWIDAPASTLDPLTLSLKGGDKAWVLVDVAGSPHLVQGRVTEVAPTSDTASRTRRVRVEIDNPKGPSRLLAGEPCYVRFSPPGSDFEKRMSDIVASGTKAAVK